MTTQFLKHGPIEEQFVKGLINHKCNKLSGTEISPDESKDLIIKVWMRDTNPLIWRKFKVCSAVSLFTFADKILIPVMGWTRNYHGYIFIDRTDGAHFGPINCD